MCKALEECQQPLEGSTQSYYLESDTIKLCRFPVLDSSAAETMVARKLWKTQRMDLQSILEDKGA